MNATHWSRLKGLDFALALIGILLTALCKGYLLLTY